MNPTLPSLVRWTLTAVAVAGLSACERPPQGAAPDPVVYVQKVRLLDGAPTAVTATDALAGQRLSGVVRPAMEADWSFRAPGLLARRLVEVGQVVKAGTVVAELELQDLTTQEAAAHAQVTAARAEEEQTQREVDRLQRLRGTGATAEVDLERQQARLTALRARTEQAERQATLARQRSSYGRLTAPYDAVVLAWRVDPGTVVGEGLPVVTMGRLGQWDVQVEVSDRQWAQLRRGKGTGIGAAASVDALGLDGLPVTLRELAAAPTPGAGGRLYRARWALPSSAAGLTAGLPAELRFTAAGAAGGAVRLPAGALLQTGAQAQVWRLHRDGSATTLKAHPVKVLHQGSQWVELGGIPAGTEVVSMGAQRLREGLAVRPVPHPVASMADPR